MSALPLPSFPVCAALSAPSLSARFHSQLRLISLSSLFLKSHDHNLPDFFACLLLLCLRVRVEPRKRGRGLSQLYGGHHKKSAATVSCWCWVLCGFCVRRGGFSAPPRPYGNEYLPNQICPEDHLQVYPALDCYRRAHVGNSRMSV